VSSALRYTIALTSLAAAASLLSLHAQSLTDQARILETARGRVTGLLRVPGSPSRPPVVFLVAPTDGPELATALAAAGVASLRIDPPDSEDTAAQWIALLRNDERFPTITVLGEGTTINLAVVAARSLRRRP
jgi:hypothetical protein